jgi:hypothetical protein
MGAAARFALRLGAALALLALAVWVVGFERLRRQLLGVDAAWLCAALAASAASQWVSVHRWESIARIFGLRVDRRALAVAYAQGMTLNVLLPGATLGGDALRSVRLQSLGNPLGVSALTVLLDRLSGLWVLCVLSLVSAAGFGLALLTGASGAAAAEPQALPAVAELLGKGPVLLLYIAGLLLFCAIPWLPLRLRAPQGGAHRPGLARRVWIRLCHLHDLAVAERAPLGRSLWISLLVQVLAALTLWLCALAAGGKVGYWQVQAVAAPVFIAGALPLSYGGFGAREVMALVAFPLAGMSSELGLAASALYGIVAVILGLAAAPSFGLGGWAAAKGAPGQGGARPD